MAKKAGCPTGPDDQRKRLRWAELLRRAFLFDVLRCHRCGGRRELIAVIKDSRTVTRILDRAKLQVRPRPTPAALVRGQLGLSAKPTPPLSHVTATGQPSKDLGRRLASYC